MGENNISRMSDVQLPSLKSTPHLFIVSQGNGSFYMQSFEKNH